MIKLGIGSFTYPWSIGVPGHMPQKPMSALELMEMARSLAVSIVQYDENLPLVRLGPSTVDTLAARSVEYGIVIELGTRGIDAEDIYDHIELALRFGSTTIRLFTDTDADQPSLSEVIDRLGPVMPAFQETGIMLAIENHDRFTSNEFRDIIEALGPTSCGICLDPINSLGVPESPRELVATLAPYVVSLHLKDFAVERVLSGMGFTITGCAVGQGRLEVPWMIEEISRTGRDVSRIVELWTPFRDDLRATIATEQAWAEESIDALRTVILD